MSTTFDRTVTFRQTAVALALSRVTALPAAQAVGFNLGDFEPARWQQIVITDDGEATLSWDLTEGIGSPGQGWLVKYTQPCTFGTGSSANCQALGYSGFSYAPPSSAR